MKKRVKKIINIVVLVLFIFSLALIMILNVKANISSIKEWNVGLSIISLILFVCLLLLHFYELIIDRIVLIYSKMMSSIKINLSNKFYNWAIQLKAKLNTESEEYHHLAPTYLEKSEYVGILKCQIDNPHIKNIAISGPYGSGKSSVIHTFQLLYPQYKCLNLSLATFALKEFTCEDDTNVNNPQDDKPQKDTIIVGSRCKGMDELEYSLVQQFFYHVKAKDIPDSRFGRIRRWNWLNKALVTISVLLFILCSLYLIKPNWVETIIKDPEFFNNSYLQYSCIAISGIILFCAIYKLVSYIHKFNGGRVKLMDYEIELKKDINTSVFNRYLDELVYFFQTTKYDIVILEDLDRFKNISIFTKLRELNSLLNQAQDIGRRIVFVYSLSDSVFEKSIERTKFFDFILPIIPHTNPSNSADQFVKILGELVNGEDDSKGITTYFIKDIAPFISDLRTIKAIVTEYKINSPLLDEKLSQQNLLAMIIYKNLCPKDFEKIYVGEGKIVDAFKNKSEFIEKRISLINEEIKKNNDEIIKIKNESLRSIEELKSIVVASLIKQIPASSYLCDMHKNKVAYNELYDDQSINNILNNKYMYYNTMFNTYENLSNKLEDGFDYDSRRENIISKYKLKEYELERIKQELEDQCVKLNGFSMKELCCLDKTIVPIENDSRENRLLNFFIKRGYIDELFYYYITIFTEGILTRNDKDYLLSIKCNDEFNVSDISHKLDNPKIILHNLISQDLQSNKIFNISLIDEILKQKEEIYKTNLIRKIKESGNELIEFVRRYIKDDSINEEFIRLVVQYNQNLWGKIEDNLSISEREKYFLFNRLLRYADAFYIYLNNSNYYDKRFIRFIENTPYTKLIDSFDIIEKFKKVIENIKPKINNISVDSSYNEFTDFLYHGNFYALNKNNILLILQRYSNISLSLYEGAIYSAVLEAKIESLLTNINDNIEYFTKECILSSYNTNELESTIVLLLNNEEISLELKKSIIEHNKTIINSVEEIDNNELRKKLYSLNKVKASLLNIACYLGYNETDKFDTILLDFINLNSESIINCIKNSEENDIAIEALLVEEGVDDKIWQEILNNPFYNEKIKSKLLCLRKEQFLFYINTEEKANFVLKHLKVADINLMNKVLALSKNKTLKMKGLASYMEDYPDLDISCINDLLISMGDKFVELTTNTGQIFEIDRSSEAELFIEQFIKRDIVSKKGGTKAKIKVLVHNN